MKKQLLLTLLAVIFSSLFSSYSQSLCGGTFTDSGGVSGNYLNDENNTYLLCPNNTGEVVTVNFTYFNLENNYDFLKVYDGNSISSPLIGTFSGQIIPNSVTSSSSNGCLTFVFTSDSTINSSGWEATVNCALPTIVSCPTPSSVNVINSSACSASVSWIENGSATQWELFVAPNGTSGPTATSPGILTNSNPYLLSGLINTTSCTIFIRSICSSTEKSSWSNPLLVSLNSNPVTNLSYLEQCDSDNDGSVIFNLTTQVTSSNPLAYYTTINNATNQINPIANATSYLISASAVNTTIYIRESIAGSCDKIYSFQLHAFADCNLAHNCNQANSLCSALGNPFTNTHQAINAEAGNGNNYGCLYTTPNPTWFYLPVSSPGNLNLTIEQSTSINFTTNNLDVDYIVYGPFTNPVAPCAAGLNQSNTVSCSYSSAAVEHPVIPNAQVGEYYLLMVTNFSNQPGFIRINMNPSSTGAIDCSGLRLNAFLDDNSNGSQDNGEVNFPLGQFHYTVNSGSVHNIIAPTGIYNIYDINGTNSYNFDFTVNTSYNGMYNVTTPSYSNINVVIGGGMVTYNFPITVTQSYNDIAVNLVPFNAPRAGSTYQNKLVYTNLGNQTISSGTLTFNSDTATSITAVSQAGITNITNGFTYTFSNLLSFETRVITITMQVPTIPIVSIGQLLTNTASIIPPVGDLVTSNDTSLSTQAIIGAYDPNDKIESHGERILFSTFNPNEYLFYTIRFENTGTASAVNVSINDILNSKIDETSLQMISASHDYTMDRIDTNLTWSFNNIQLPVSVAGTNIGKGYVTFKVKLKPGFSAGDIIPNTASIYFDSNPAIITNTFQTEFVAALANTIFESNNLLLYPNPTHSSVQINLQNTSEKLTSIIIYDVVGKTIKTIKNLPTNDLNLDVSYLSKGVYLIEISTETNLKLIKKLIIQ